jgi:hypothetical protein
MCRGPLLLERDSAARRAVGGVAGEAVVAEAYQLGAVRRLHSGHIPGDCRARHGQRRGRTVGLQSGATVAGDGAVANRDQRGRGSDARNGRNAQKLIFSTDAVCYRDGDCASAVAAEHAQAVQVVVQVDVIEHRNHGTGSKGTDQDSGTGIVLGRQPVASNCSGASDKVPITAAWRASGRLGTGQQRRA